MNDHLSSLYKGNLYSILLATLALPNISSAETFDFKVVYAEVPGINEIVAGDADAAIEILEARSKDPTRFYIPDELSTLCALYIMKGRLPDARKTCDTAVETDRSHTAYNNRGVLRVHLGDSAGAIKDFARVRVLPDNQQRYIEELKKRDARLVASGNYAVAQKLSAKRMQPWQSLANSVRGASVEELGNQ
jgi:tetratricopeptide (TPR) repeat protein